MDAFQPYTAGSSIDAEEDPVVGSKCVHCSVFPEVNKPWEGEIPCVLAAVSFIHDIFEPCTAKSVILK